MIHQHSSRWCYILTLIACTSILSANSSLATETPRFFKVHKVLPGHVLWVHSNAGVNSARIGFLPYRARHIANLGCRGNWCMISYRDTIGWVSLNYLVEDTEHLASWTE
jgi:hypothetical protein